MAGVLRAAPAAEAEGAVAAQGVGLPFAAQPAVAVAPGAAQGRPLVALHVEAPRLAAPSAGPALMAQPVAVEPPRVESSAVAAQVVPDADWAEVATLAALA